MTKEYIIDVQNITKRFNAKTVVDNISLKVKKGEIFGFLGPNGSGKTTTIRLLCGLLTADSGVGQCLGYDILHHTGWMKHLVGYVPQCFSLYKDLTVLENLQFIARIYKKRDYIKRVNELMGDLNLEQYKNHLAGQLSGGWKQRLSLAAALIHEPKLLLLDEPTAGLDPKARREFWDYISQLTAKGITALVSTHYTDEAERCHRLAYIVYGRLMAEGTISEIIEQAGLVTWSAQGNNTAALAQYIRNQEGIEQVTVWGNELRVCGTNTQLIRQGISKYSDYIWQNVTTSLEEVFIHLVNQRSLVKEPI
jgi:ABC-2 type transport system ATP-binding protein